MNKRKAGLFLALSIALILLSVPLLQVLQQPPRLTLTFGNPAYAAESPDCQADGVADDVQFTTCLNLLPATGGIIRVVSTGTFNFTAAVTRAIDNVTIEGIGRGSYFANNGVTALFTAGGNNWVFRDLRTDAGGINMGATTGWEWENVTIDTTYYAERADNTAGPALFEIPVGLLFGSTAYVVASDAPAITRAAATVLNVFTDLVQVTNGTADNAEIQTAATTASGGRVVLSDGNFTFTATVTPPIRTVIEGQGPLATTINGAGAFSFFTLSATNVQLKNFGINGTNRTHTTAAIDITSGANYLEDLYIVDVRAEAVKYSGIAYDNFARGLIIEQCGYATNSEAVLDLSGDANANIFTDIHIEENQWHAVRTQGQALANRFVNIKVHGDVAGTRYRAFSFESVRNEISAGYIANNDVGIYISGASNIVNTTYIVSTDTTAIDNISRENIFGDIHIESTAVGISNTWHRNIYNVIKIDGATGAAVSVTGGNFNQFNGITVYNSSQQAFNVVANDNDFYDITVHNIGTGAVNTYDAFYIDGDRNTFIKGRVEDDTPNMRYAFNIAAGELNNVIEQFVLNDNGATGKISDSGTGTRIRGNIGYATENSGTATILNTTTSITVTHGLAVTPTGADCKAWGLENPTNTPGLVWLDTFTSTQFNINVENDPGVSNLDVGWACEVY